MKAKNYEGLISAYVNETLKVKDRQAIEDLIASHADINEIYLEKIQRKDFCLQLIPDQKLSANRMNHLKSEIKKVNEDVFPEQKLSLLKKVVKHMKEPAFTVEF